jgi:hypothetical protein
MTVAASMSQIQTLHQQIIDLAEAAAVARLEAQSTKRNTDYPKSISEASGN